MVGKPCGVDEKLRLLPAMEDRLSMDHRHIANIGAADIEQPGDRIGKRDDGGFGTLLFKSIGNFRQFFRGAATSELRGLHIHKP